MPGAICRSSNGEDFKTYANTATELHLFDGSVWLAQRRSDKQYVFTRTHGQHDVKIDGPGYVGQVRWILDKPVEAWGPQDNKPELECPQFRFAPNCKGYDAYPVIARISPEVLMVRHSWNMPGRWWVRRDLDESLQALVVVSGTWVALMEEWSSVAQRNAEGNALQDYRKDSAADSTVSKPENYDERTITFESGMCAHTHDHLFEWTAAGRRGSHVSQHTFWDGAENVVHSAEGGGVSAQAIAHDGANDQGVGQDDGAHKQVANGSAAGKRSWIKRALDKLKTPSKKHKF